MGVRAVAVCRPRATHSLCPRKTRNSDLPIEAGRRRCVASDQSSSHHSPKRYSSPFLSLLYCDLRATCSTPVPGFAHVAAPPPHPLCRGLRSHRTPSPYRHLLRNLLPRRRKEHPRPDKRWPSLARRHQVGPTPGRGNRRRAPVPPAGERCRPARLEPRGPATRVPVMRRAEETKEHAARRAGLRPRLRPRTTPGPPDNPERIYSSKPRKSRTGPGWSANRVRFSPGQSRISRRRPVVPPAFSPRRWPLDTQGARR